MKIKGNENIQNWKELKTKGKNKKKIKIGKLIN